MISTRCLYSRFGRKRAQGIDERGNSHWRQRTTFLVIAAMVGRALINFFIKSPEYQRRFPKFRIFYARD